MRKRTRRKHWPLLEDPVGHARHGAALIDTEALDRLRLFELSALESFARGLAEPNDWRVLADMLNLSETLARDFRVGRDEVLELNLLAQQILGAAAGRERLAFTEAELNVMRDAREYAELQRASVARSVFKEAIRLSAARIQSADRSKVTVITMKGNA